MHPKDISILDFSYALPDEKIALHPLEKRDHSKLLVYKSGHIVTDTYSHLHSHLPKNSLLIFNNTKVINARIFFTKPTGGVIEIFLLEPYDSDYTLTLAATQRCQWKCLIGGISKWKEGSLQLVINDYVLTALLTKK